MKPATEDRTGWLLPEQPVLPLPLPDHDGETYVAGADKARLNAQTQRVFDTVSDGRWRTLAEIASATGDPEASISARLRDLRKEKFGGYTVERRRRGLAVRGLHEYRFLGKPTTEPEPECGFQPTAP